jgi:hypothetical protein
VVQVKNGCYIGYGYADIESGYQGISDLHDCVKPGRDTRDIRQIIRTYLKSGKYEKLVVY